MNVLRKTTAQCCALLLLCGLMSACAGFHLRNQAQIAAPELRILRVTGDPESVAAIREPLREAGVLIDPHADYELQLTNYETHQQVLGYPNGAVGQYTLSGTLTWSLVTSSGQVLLGPKDQNGQREYNYDRSGSSVSGLVQMNSFSHALFEDLAQQIISQLAALNSAELAQLKQHSTPQKTQHTEQDQDASMLP